ncbi:hypothetical protein PoB_001232200 [Plakobranchus ocellatus]|uniref:Uncharacterized protein n=1 Tax=Plakobranchus ocellatus TaxID=259542 RepID=A0AAV3YSB3_9GAST|nr:hypothetical protein PoB_001232200 [Plakobranchus ocellatus]
MAGDRPGWCPNKPVNEIFWRRERVAMTTAAKIIRKFLRRAMQLTGDQAPAFTSEIRVATNSPKSKAKSPNCVVILFFNGNSYLVL